MKKLSNAAPKSSKFMQGVDPTPPADTKPRPLSIVEPPINGPPQEAQRLNIKVAEARVIRISQVGPSEWSHRGSYSVQDALVIRFTNEAREGSSRGPTVRALLTYTDAAQREVLRVTGGWIDPPAEVAELGGERSHELIVGVLSNGQFVAVERVRTKTEGGENSLMKQRPLPGFQRGSVVVSLIDIHTRQLLYEDRFEIGVNPLRISSR